MDELLEVMQLIDRNSEKLPEGDYLEICNRLKKAFNKRSDPEFFFDYENFEIPMMGPTEDVHEYFYNYYTDQALGLDSDYLSGQIDYLRKEYGRTEPLKRKTKNIKDIAVKHYCLTNNLIPEEHTAESLGLTNEDVMSMTKAYMRIENAFREKYRQAIERRLDSLEEAEDKLYEM
jgi:hypothetical protein